MKTERTFNLFIWISNFSSRDPSNLCANLMEFYWSSICWTWFKLLYPVSQKNVTVVNSDVQKSVLSECKFTYQAFSGCGTADQHLTSRAKWAGHLTVRQKRSRWPRHRPGVHTGRRRQRVQVRGTTLMKLVSLPIFSVQTRSPRRNIICVLIAGSRIKPGKTEIA